MIAEDMLAREAIRYTIETYNRNTDSANYDAHCEVFHPEAEMAVQNGASLNGLPAIIAGLRAGYFNRKGDKPGNFQRHNLTSIMIELQSDRTASAVTYVLVITEKGFDHAGRYDDQFERVGDRWLIRRRLATMEWAIPDSRFMAWLGNPSTVESGQGT